MGIYGFKELVNKYSRVHNKKIEDYGDQIISMDTSIHVYKFKTSILGGTKGGLKRSDGKDISHILGLYNKTIMLLKYNIVPVWVFDGIPPDLKQDTLVKRRKLKEDAEVKLSSPDLSDSDIIKFKKRTVKIRTDDIQDLKTMFSLMGIPTVQAHTDAEAQCAANELGGICNGTATDDNDYLLFGGETLIKNLSTKGYVTEIRLGDILRDLKLTREELIEVCIILGTDYCPPIKGIGAISAYELYIKHDKNIKKLLKYFRSENLKNKKLGKDPKYIIPQNFNELFNRTKEYFMKTLVIDPKQINVKFNKPDYEKLTKFLQDNEIGKIEEKIDTLKNLYHKNSL